MEYKTLKHIESKGKNKRINIYLLEATDGFKSLAIHTRTLIDFKTRNILKTDTLYSVETFSVLSNLMNYSINDSEVKNKILLKELNDIIPFNAKTNLKKQ